MADPLLPLAVVLEVDGTRFAAWTALEAQTSIEQMSGGFRLEVTDRWLAGELQDILPGQSCVLRLGDQIVITGAVDAVTRTIDSRAHQVSVSGRDKTADLIDCSATGGPWTEQTLAAIARELCGAYGVEVRVEGAAAGLAKPFPKVAVEPGESCHELIERLARERGVLLWTDGQGGLIMGQPGRTLVETALAVGVNLLSLSHTLDYKDRFSEYLCLGQAVGSDERHGKDAAAVQARAEDAIVGRYRRRPKTVIAEGSASELQARADWERTVRFGRSFRAQGVVQGWTMEDGQLWRAGDLVQLTSEVRERDGERLAYVHGQQLIAGVTYRLDQGGTTTELDLTLPAAFTPEPPPEEKPR